VALIWYLFHRNYRRRQAQRDPDADRPRAGGRARAPDGEREQHRLDAYWLRIELGDRLVLTSRGNRVAIGRFLGAPERQRVAERAAGGARGDALAPLPP
jgi:uncharacterized membrane protein